MPIRHRPDFEKALSTFHRLKKTEDKAHNENWSQSSFSWWQWQTTWWEPYYETSPQRWTEHWWNGETCDNQWIVYLFVAWISARIWCTIYSDYIGNSQRSSLSPTGGCKLNTSWYSNSRTNGYVKIKRTSSWPMRTTIMTTSTPTRMTRTTMTYAICTSEHSSAPLVVFPVLMIMCHTTLAKVFLESFISCHLHAMCMCVCLWSSLPPFLLQPVLPRPLPLLCPDAPWPPHRPLQPGLREK